jgi:hypothetical protein
MKLGFSKVFNYFYLGLGHLRTATRHLLSDRVSLFFIITSLGLNALIWVGAYLLQRSIGNDLAVLHYNIVFGVDLIGSANRLYLIPTIGLGIIILNGLMVTAVFGSRERMLTMVCLGASIILNFFCLVALYFSYLINFS